MRRALALCLLLAFAPPALAKKPPNTPLIHPSAEQSLPAVPADKAQVVFLRPSDYFTGMFNQVYEVTPAGDDFISMMGGHHKVVVTVAPGAHTFMANNGVGAHFLDADLVAGKRYFVLVRPIHGNGFQLRPLRRDGSTDYNTKVPEFAAWLADTMRMEADDGAEKLFDPRVQKALDKARAKGWETHVAKSPEQRAELTLRADDGHDAAPVAVPAQ